MNMSAVHALRSELNSNTTDFKVLRKFPLPVIIGVLKQYLIELPISVCRYGEAIGCLGGEKEDGK